MSFVRIIGGLTIRLVLHPILNLQEEKSEFWRIANVTVLTFGKMSVLLVLCLALARWYAVVQPIRFRYNFTRLATSRAQSGRKRNRAQSARGSARSEAREASTTCFACRKSNRVTSLWREASGCFHELMFQLIRRLTKINYFLRFVSSCDNRTGRLKRPYFYPVLLETMERRPCRSCILL